MILPKKHDFLKETQYSNLPLYSVFNEDVYTPIGIFEKVKSLNPAFLLESAGEHQGAGRYSYIGIDTYDVTNDYSHVSELKTNSKALKPDYLKRLPPFTNGIIGYLSYDYVKDLYGIKGYDTLPYQLMSCKTLIVMDHYKNQLYIIYNANINESDYNFGVNRITEINNLLLSDIKRRNYKLKGTLNIQSNVSKQEFMEAVNKAKDYIKNGDIFQVVLSQQFSAEVNDLCAFELYKSVRRENPSPYLSYLRYKDRTIICSSPEMLIKFQNHQVETVPIAGTRAVKDDGKDVIRAEELLLDPKENAEHLMLVDLSRNDLGKIAKPGTVKVIEYCRIKKFSKVMHLVSKVTAQCEENISGIDTLISAFPAGTVSGAPKKRALEIIHELEKTPRDLYAGTIFYLNEDGNLNSCIAIRTIQIKDNTLTLQAGAGIVYDSKPEDEYKETIHKASALFNAIANLYEGGFHYDFSH
ncbi:MAG: anthranilate synthase component I family protein [Clostridia bacterium]|nr:anthranilate synthase component I family protein [Clostridia bacterium]